MKPHRFGADSAMLQLTKKTEYGLIALTHLARRGRAVTSVREICESYPVPRRLLAEVLKDLCHAQLVESHRGSSGGYSLARSPEAISVGDVVAALEGHPSLTSCASLGAYVAHSCEVEHVCPIRSPIETLRLELWRLLSRTTLRDLATHPSAPQTARESASILARP
jgi:Rrf2 family protein